MIRPARGPTFEVDARLDLAHRRVPAAARGGDVDYAVAEELAGLVVLAVRRAGTLWAGPVAAGPAGHRVDRQLAVAARNAILDGHPAATGLLPLAGLLRVSPYRLSRAFSRHAGVSLTRYRNRVRVGRALDRLEAGERSLATLAADLGFADQTHLTRAVRSHVGHPPAVLRGLLAVPPRAGAAAGHSTP